MKAIVFGGAGFIGSHLAASLVKSGAEVTVADIAEPEWRVDGVEYVTCDVRQPITITRTEPFDAVYNLAAVHRTPGHPPHEYYETNVFGAQRITEWCAEGGEQQIFFTSSIAVYGPTEETKTEESELTPNSDYGRSKLMAEGIHRRWLDADAKRRLVVVRPAVVFGRGEHGNFTRLAHALDRGRFMYAGRTDVIKACGYVGDLVRALDWAAKNPEREQTFNYCYPVAYTIEQICEAFHDVAGYKRPRMLPQAPLAIAMKSLKLVNPGDKGTLSAARVAKLTASTNIAPGVLVKRGFSWETDITSALAAWSADTSGEFY